MNCNSFLIQPDEKERKDKEKRDTTQDTEKDKSQVRKQMQKYPGGHLGRGTFGRPNEHVSNFTKTMNLSPLSKNKH